MGGRGEGGGVLVPDNQVNWEAVIQDYLSVPMLTVYTIPYKIMLRKYEPSHLITNEFHGTAHVMVRAEIFMVRTGSECNGIFTFMIHMVHAMVTYLLQVTSNPQGVRYFLCWFCLSHLGCGEKGLKSLKIDICFDKKPI